MFRQRATVKQKIVFMVAASFFLFSLYGLYTLIDNYGINPLANRGDLSLSQLLGGEESSLSQGSVQGESSDITYPVETVSVSQNQVGPNTVSFVRANNSVLLRYKNIVYGPQFEKTPPRPAEIGDPELYPWVPLVNPPSRNLTVDELYSFTSTQDLNRFVFIMKWGETGNFGNTNVTYSVYAYDELQTYNKFRKVADIAESEGIPWVKSISWEGFFVALDISNCESCANKTEKTVLINTITGQSRNLGPTRDFTWFYDGNYEYTNVQTGEIQSGTI